MAAKKPCREDRGVCQPSPITAAATGIAPSARAPPPSSGSRQVVGVPHARGGKKQKKPFKKHSGPHGDDREARP